MNPLLFWLIALVALSALGPLVRLAIAAVFGKQVGVHALAKQPDTIHLKRRDATVWRNASAARRYLPTDPADFLRSVVPLALLGLAAIADTDAATDALLRTVDVAQACCSMQQR